MYSTTACTAPLLTSRTFPLLSRSSRLTRCTAFTGTNCQLINVQMETSFMFLICVSSHATVVKLSVCNLSSFFCDECLLSVCISMFFREHLTQFMLRLQHFLSRCGWVGPLFFWGDKKNLGTVRVKPLFVGRFLTELSMSTFLNHHWLSLHVFWRRRVLISTTFICR